jgi:hypothetical protein
MGPKKIRRFCQGFPSVMSLGANNLLIDVIDALLLMNSAIVSVGNFIVNAQFAFYGWFIANAKTQRPFI